MTFYKIKNILSLVVVISTISCSNISSDRNDILAVMDMQQEAWSNGDVEAFMQGYWNSDSLMFVGKNGIKYGWQTTLDNYKKSYSDKAAMGKLEFDVIKLEVNKNTAYMLGMWSLIRAEDNPNGHFALYWKKIDGKWVITIDHTS